MASKLSLSLQATAEIYGKSMGSFAVEMLIEDLQGYTEEDLLAALSRCRRELRTFPTVADIISRIDDGRPGIEEAWAMIPKSEDQSVVWTEEMRDAYCVVRPLIENDPIAARMAFKETYTKLLADSRAARRISKWEPSLGFDKNGQQAVINAALQKNRITLEHAQQLLPDLTSTNKKILLDGPTEEPSLSGLAEVMSVVLKNAPKHVQVKELARKIETKELTPEQIEARKRELLQQKRILDAEE